jgi:hypothetical protein
LNCLITNGKGPSSSKRSEKGVRFYIELCDVVTHYLEDKTGEYFSDFEVLPPLEYKVSEEQ